MKIDDWDELEEAYQSGELSEEQDNAALEEAERILYDLCSDIPKTNAWCAGIRQMVEDRIANGEAGMKRIEDISEQPATF